MFYTTLIFFNHFRGGFHKELRLVLPQVRMSYSSKLRTSLSFVISPRTHPKLRLVQTLCEIDPRSVFKRISLTLCCQQLESYDLWLALGCCKPSLALAQQPFLFFFFCFSSHLARSTNDIPNATPSLASYESCMGITQLKTQGTLWSCRSNHFPLWKTR